jgi:hypothetical protein
MTKLSAIRLDAPELQLEVATYQTDVLEVCAYANALYNVALPTDFTYGWYTEYAGKLRGVRSDIGVWELIYQRLFDVPRQIMSTSTAMKDELNAAFADARALKQNPGDALRLAVFRNRLGTMEMVATGFAGNAQQLAADLDGYTLRLKGHVVVFHEIVKRAEGTITTKQADIEALNQAITALRERVRVLGLSVAALSVATAGGVVIGIVGLVLAPFTGGGSLVLLVPAAAVIAAGSVGIGLTAHELKQANGDIAAKSAQMAADAAAVVQLQQVTRTFQEFVERNERVQESLERMEARWVALGEVLRTMIADLEDARPEAQPDWDEIIDDLERARGDWQSVDALAHDLTLVEVTKVTNPASLKIGMTEEQVAAVAKSEGRPFGGVYMALA